MAFNVGNFIKDTSKTVVDRVVDKITSSASNGLPESSKSIAESSAKAYFNIGYSYENVSAFSSAKTDNAIANGADEFFAAAGKNIARVSKVDLKKLRRTSDDSTYINEINPTTKIAAAKKDGSVEIITVL